LADYFTINISSPNTPGLRDLQGGEALTELLERLGQARALLTAASPAATPIFLKVAPDLEDERIEAVTETAIAAGVDALIVGNTTVARPASLRSPLSSQTGGLSGAPLMGPSTEILKRFHEAATARIDLIGVGGIASGADAYAKIRAGAAAVQLYSAMVYEGPGLVGRIQRDLAARLKGDGFGKVAEAVGAR
jgi:dihydroorotate dehydrogenase